MEKLFKKIIESDNFFFKPIFFILFLLSLIYKIIIIQKRKKGYKERVGNSFIISVGNITLGGTGKTPFVIYLAKKLSKKYKVCIILRGYKSLIKEKALLIENLNNYSPFHIGDEPFLIAKKTDLPVIISRNRKDGIILAERKLKPDIIILDDAFQHFKIKRNLDIILIDYFNPFGNNFLFPAGILREPIEVLKYANIIVITKYEKTAKVKLNLSMLKKIIRRFNISAPIFTSNYIPDIKIPKNKKIFAFAGIGNFNYFMFLIKKFFKPAKFNFIQFPDHYNYSTKDIEKILKLSKKYDLILTTEKDYVKLNSKNIKPLKIKLNIYNENKFLKCLEYEIKKQI